MSDELAIEPAPERARVPPFIVVVPVYVFTSPKVNVPVPLFTREIDPAIIPELASVPSP